MALPARRPDAKVKEALRGLSAHFADIKDNLEPTDTLLYKRHALDTLPSRLPENSSPADVVYQQIHDLRMLDSNPRLNLASYVTTWMEDHAQKLMMESMSVNHADAAIYPSSTDIENKCVRILADLFHAEKPDETLGCATIGSTEAALLGGLNMKKWWMDARRAKGLPTDKPNIIVSYSYQVCWHKFARYWDVEMRLAHMKEGCYVLTPEEVERMADENTIGVVAILGSTYTGHFDDVNAINDVCDKLRKEKGLDLKIHVDGASGGLVAPFLFPELVWDFKLKNVISICVSGHKYGYVYPGVGWQLWRSKESVHPDLVFHLNYLGSDQTNLTLNFSRPASQIVASYYQFLRLGRRGYTLLATSLQAVACHMAAGIEALGAFQLHNNPKDTVPLIAFSLKPYDPDNLPHSDIRSDDDEQSTQPIMRPYTEFEFVEQLRQHGWSVPAYKMAPDLGHIVVCRIVIREDFSKTLADELLKAMSHALQWLDAHFAKWTREERDMMAERTKHLAPGKAPSTLSERSKTHVVC